MTENFVSNILLEIALSCDDAAMAAEITAMGRGIAIGFLPEEGLVSIDKKAPAAEQMLEISEIFRRVGALVHAAWARKVAGILEKKKGDRDDRKVKKIAKD